MLSATASALTVAQTAIHTTAGDSIRTAAWTAVGLMVVTLGTIVVALIKSRAPGKKVDNDALAEAREASAVAREADFKRLREDIDKLTVRVAVAENKASTAETHAVRSDAKLGSALAACEIMLGLVEKEMPNAHEIPLVKRLLAQAASDDMGIGSAMRDLARAPGVGARS